MRLVQLQHVVRPFLIFRLFRAIKHVFFFHLLHPAGVVLVIRLRRTIQLRGSLKLLFIIKLVPGTCRVIVEPGPFRPARPLGLILFHRVFGALLFRFCAAKVVFCLLKFLRACRGAIRHGAGGGCVY